MIHKRFLPIVLLLIINCAVAQSSDNKIPDSLSAKKRLLKAKSQKDYYHMALEYKAVMYQSDKKQHLFYSDSMLIAAHRTDDNLLIGSAYMTRATVFYGQKEHNKALDNFIKADEFISRTNDSYSIYKVKYGIAQTKYYLGFYDEAISLFRECIDYYKEENDRAYLNSIHCLGLCYNRIGNYEGCTLTNQLGIDEGRKLENSEMEPYFIHSEGINECCKGKYNLAIKKLNLALTGIINYRDFANESVAYFYIGKALWSLKQQDKAIGYFKKVNAIFEKEKYIRPDLREGYELLIDFYKKQNDTKSQLLYINQLLKVDRILEHNYKYLINKVIKEYDTKELIKAKLDIENTMSFRTVIGFGIISIMGVVMIYLIYRHFKNKKLFEELMKDGAAKQVTSNNKLASPEITPEIEIGIVKKLEKFESGKRYLEKDMNLVKMASLLNTNTKYVTKIIVKHRNKGTIEYITDLKIFYVIEILKKESKFRNYTNKALGEEAGFGSTQNFTRAFKNRTGITPTYFIYKLKKSIAADISQ